MNQQLRNIYVDHLLSVVMSFYSGPVVPSAERMRADLDEFLSLFERAVPAADENRQRVALIREVADLLQGQPRSVRDVLLLSELSSKLRRRADLLERTATVPQPKKSA